jgi:hypothetical protein
MTPFQVFRRLVKQVGLFGRVDYDVVASIGLYKPVQELTSESIANLALNYLTLDEREVLIQALSIKNLERALDPERNRDILAKAGVNLEVQPEPDTRLIKPSVEALTEILDDLNEKYAPTEPDVDALIAMATKEPNPVTKKIGVLEITEEEVSTEIPHSSK